MAECGKKVTEQRSAARRGARRVWLRTAINQRLALNRPPFDNYKVNRLSNRPSSRVMAGSVASHARLSAVPTYRTRAGERQLREA